jgi:hypothetical protein
MFYVFSVLLPVRFFANAYADPEPGKEMLNLSFRFRCATVFAGFRCCDDCVAVYFGSVDCKREQKNFPIRKRMLFVFYGVRSGAASANAHAN